jgi:CRP/FNR family transcriptional regulator, cyclic AMP receptor protein
MQNIGKSIYFFELLTPDERRRMEARAIRIRMRKGQTIIESGSHSRDVYFLIEGELRVLLFSPDGKEVSVRTLRPGQMFGELAALDGLPRSATVVATAPSVVVSMRVADFRACIASSADAALWLAENLASQIRALTDRLFELAALNVRSRLHCELLRLAAVAGQIGSRAVIRPFPTHAELANRIGTHREAVTRELRDLARIGLVAQGARSLTILDIERLSSLVLKSNGHVSGLSSVLKAGAPHIA